MFCQSTIMICNCICNPGQGFCVCRQCHWQKVLCLRMMPHVTFMQVVIL